MLTRRWLRPTGIFGYAGTMYTGLVEVNFKSAAQHKNS